MCIRDSLLEAQGLRVAHLGDIGAMPAPDVVERLQNLDAVLVPVSYTHLDVYKRQALERGLSVCLFDKNRQLGRKVRITGKGRCNVTNNCPAEEVVAACPRGGKFLYGALSAFSPQDTMAFFEGLDVPLKTERGRRVFPVSDNAHDIAGALERYAAGATVIREAVTAVLVENGRAVGVRTAAGTYRGGSVILCCGGASYPGTGSNGDGYKLAAAVGHTIVTPTPSLVPLVERGPWCRQLMGLSLRNCGVKVTQRGKKKPVYEDFGELLFTCLLYTSRCV